MDKRKDFHDAADRRHIEFLTSGVSIPWAEMRCHLLRRLIDLSRQRPVPRALLIASSGTPDSQRSNPDP
jgi:hypothetical protein